MSEKWAAWWKRSGRYLAMLIWLPLVLLVVVGIIALRSAHQKQRDTFQSAVSEQRTQLIRVATKIEMALDSTGPSTDWEPLQADQRVRAKWLPSLLTSDQTLYAAIVEPTGRILFHSDLKSEGQPIGIAWYDEIIPAADFSVVKVTAGPLSQGQSAFDVRVPIQHADHLLGEIHSGLSVDKLDIVLNGVYWAVLRGFLFPAGIALVTAILAYYALAQLVIANEHCHRLTTTTAVMHARELEQIAAGLAHEIRNPLHAIRINLHVLSKLNTPKTQLSPEDLASTVSSSSAEVERVEQIIRDLLRFSIPDPGKPVPLNLVTELQATVNLMREDLKRKEIELVVAEPLPASWVTVDSAIFRQILVDLLTFSENNAGARGRIDVVVTHQGPDCELEIRDHGTTLSESQRLHLFEPFQSPQKTGSSLGLALARSSVEQAGGSILCVENFPQGNRILLKFPRLNPPHFAGAS